MRTEPNLPTLVLAARRRLELWNAQGAYDGADGRFEAVHERHGSARLPLRGRSLLEATTVECRRGLRGGFECAECPHLLNIVPDADHMGLTVRCVYFDDDPVHALMTPRVALVTIPSIASVGAARELLAAHRVSRLIVTAGREVVGLVSAPDLDDALAEARVELCYPQDPLRSIPARTPLAVVARLFRTPDLRLLIVTDVDDVAGVVSRGDLRRAGVPDVFLDPLSPPDHDERV